MKRTLLLLLCTITIGLSACKKETIITEPVNRTILFDIFPQDWTPSTDGLSYYRDIQVPENTADFNQSGQIVVAMSFEDVNIYEGLPQVYKGLTYRFTTEPGFVRIILNDPYDAPVSRPTFESTAKVTLIDGRIID